jgi:hypothetical protein
MRGQIQVMAVLALMVMSGAGHVLWADTPPAPTPTPSRNEVARQALLDQLDDARVNRELLELEVEVLRTQIRNLMAAMTAVQPGNPEINNKEYQQKLDRACREFALKSKELYRERRRVGELEAQLDLAAAAVQPSPSPGSAPERAARLQREAERLLELIRKGVETWRGDSPPAPDGRPRPKPAPEQDLLEDAQRLLDLIRRGVEAWQDR